MLGFCKIIFQGIFSIEAFIYTCGVLQIYLRPVERTEPQIYLFKIVIDLGGHIERLIFND